MGKKNFKNQKLFRVDCQIKTNIDKELKQKLKLRFTNKRKQKMASHKSDKNLSLSTKIQETAQFLRKEIASLQSSKALTRKKITPRSKQPDVSVINVIERISKLLRKEAQEFENRKISGE
jgi:hypothetical protein